MTSKLDFAAALGEQLKAAGAQMRAMRTPKDDSPVAQTPDHPALDVSIETAPTATVTATPPAAADATVAVTPRDATVCSATRTTETVPTATATVAATVTNESSSSAAPDTRHSEADTAGNALKTAPNSGIPDGSRAAGSDEKIVTVTVTKTVTSDIPHAVPSPTREAERALSSTFPHATPESASPSPDAGGERRSGTAIPPSMASGAAPDPRNHAAASGETTPCSPALSERAWRGGVRGAVLDMLHQLAPGQDYVLVNLKRLAAHMGISYGSVRNAMSRLAQSGDISTRQIRVADGHGVRVDFHDDSARQSRRSHGRRETGTGQGRSQRAARSAGSTDSPRSAGGSDPSGGPSFWDTPDDVFLLAWPHAAAAGVNMDLLRSLRAVFTAQGFSEAGLPRSLRHLDWQLEQLKHGGTDDPSVIDSLVETFLSRLRRQGYLPRPQGYEDPELLRLREEAGERDTYDAARTEHR